MQGIIWKRFVASFPFEIVWYEAYEIKVDNSIWSAILQMIRICKIINFLNFGIHLHVDSQKQQTHKSYVGQKFSSKYCQWIDHNTWPALDLAHLELILVFK